MCLSSEPFADERLTITVEAPADADDKDIGAALLEIERDYEIGEWNIEHCETRIEGHDVLDLGEASIRLARNEEGELEEDGGQPEHP